jgi:hypothetical protein
LLPPEIGLRLYRTGVTGEDKRLLMEKAPSRTLALQASQAM